MTARARRSLIAALVAALAALGLIVTITPTPGPSPTPAITASASPTITATATPLAATPTITAIPTASPAIACAPTDQDQYVYSPLRFVIIAACIRVTGTVAVVRREPDGDLHILLALDPAYASLVNAVNVAQQHGDLVIEPVCVGPVTQASAIAACATDKTPLTVLPTVGQHVWMEGRYVLDRQHGGWTELHPLYRFGLL